jgi:hypothetical protein
LAYGKCTWALFLKTNPFAATRFTCLHKKIKNRKF